MKRLLLVCIVLVSAGWCCDAEAGCRARTPVRTVGAAVLKARPVRRVLKKTLVRKALARLVCRG